MEEVKVGDLTINPRLNKEFDEVHPAIGVVGDTAYVGVWIPCQVTDKKGNVAYRDLLFLVTDKRELVLANDETLRERGWRLAYKPVHFQNRWDLKHVDSYLNGNAVDPCQVLDNLIHRWREYVEFQDERDYFFHSLWDVGTYYYHMVNAFPYPYIGGVKRCGKTKVLTVHNCLAFNAIFSNNMSTASLYRLIQNGRATLLIDETEKLSSLERALDFRSILLAGYKKGAVVYRVEKTRKEKLEPESFEVYSPKALANIYGLEDVLEDRCIPTIMRRSRNRAVIDREVDFNDPVWGELRSELYALFLSYWKEIKAIYDRISEFSELNELVNFLGINDIDENMRKNAEFLSGRELELWRVLLALAKFFDEKAFVLSKFTCSFGSLSSLILGLAVDCAKQRQTENVTETGEMILVQVLLGMVKENRYVKVKDIRDKMGEQFDEEQGWLDTRWVGRALRRLGFKEKRRVGTGYEYLLFVDHVKDLANRMGVETEGPSFGEKLEEIKRWIIENKDSESLVDQSKLAAMCRELELDPQRIVEKLKEEGFLSEAPNVGKFVVNSP